MDLIGWSKVNDLALLNLFYMGILDWMGPNNHLHQATQAIRHSTALHLQTFSCIMDFGMQGEEPMV